MKTFSACLVALALLVSAGIFFLAKKPQPTPLAIDPAPAPAELGTPPLVSTPATAPSASEASKPSVPATTPSAPHSKPAAKPRFAKITIKAGEPIPELFPHQAERDQLYSLAASRDPAAISTIAQALKHPDSTVREAARQALVQTGDESAVPHLEDAVPVAKDPAEAKALKEAAEFLSLPRFMDVLVTHHLPAAAAKSADAK